MLYDKFRIILICAFIFIPALSVHAKEKKQVLLIYSQDKWHPAHEITENGFLSVLNSNLHFDIQLHAEYLDLARFSSVPQKKVSAEYIQKKYRDVKIDSIIAVYDTAFDFVVNGGTPLFPDVPIIGCELSWKTGLEQNSSPLRRMATGTIVGGNMSQLLEEIFRLMPNTQHVALICGSSISDQDSDVIFRRELKPFLGKVDLIDLAQLSLEEILRRVAMLPPDTVVLYGSLFQDGRGNLYVPRDAIHRISAVSNAPVFGLYDSYLGYGIVGGHLLSFKELGKESARILLRVLGGEAPDTIPWSGMDAYVKAYDWRELARWGIAQSALPSGSELRFYTPSFWETYKRGILLTAALGLAEFLLILYLMQNIMHRRKAEQSLHESEERVRLAVEASNTGLWSLDLNTNEIWSTNTTKSLHGINVDESVPLEKFIEAIHPDDRHLAIRFLKLAQQSSEENRGEWRVLLADGSIRWLTVFGELRRNVHDANTLLLQGACIDITRLKQNEISLRQHKEELEKLAACLIDKQEAELKHLSRVFHDDLTQRSAALVIDLGLIANSMPQSNPRDQLFGIKNKLTEVSKDLHSLSRTLHPAILNDLGFCRAAKNECEAFQKRTGIGVTCFVDELCRGTMFEVELCLYRILQECLQNILKHSGATEAWVCLEAYHDVVMLTIQDFGAGFDLAKNTRGTGIGHINMRERVHRLNGVILIDAELGAGTTVKVCIPIMGEGNVSNEDIAR